MTQRTSRRKPLQPMQNSERFFIPGQRGVTFSTWGLLLLDTAEFIALSELVPLITQMRDDKYEVMCLNEEHFSYAEAALYAIREYENYEGGP